MITIGELRAGSLSRRWGEAKLNELAQHLGGYVILPVDELVADAYATLRVRTERLGQRRPVNDLWIAATARRHGIPVATLDQDFMLMPGLRVIAGDGTETVVPD